MKKNFVLRFVFSLLTLSCIIFIFLLSAEQGEQSTHTSGWFTNIVAHILNPDFESLSSEERFAIISKLHGPIRTLAHFLIYAVLGFFSSATAFTFDISFKKRFFFPFIFSVLYAISDEIHQYFVPNRAFQLFDIAVDGLGVITGIGALFALYFIVDSLTKRIKNRKGARP